MRFGGPAAGHALLQTAADPDGRTVLGTFNNCASGMHAVGHLPHLRGELQRLLRQAAATQIPIAAEARAEALGARAAAATAGTSTTSASTPPKHPNEPNRFGWVVEIDPFDPASDAGQAHRARPLRHEGAPVAA